MVMDVHGRDLRYFVTVADELHFTRAAERLFVSQPALSKQIRMLERQLGAPLFDRGRDGVRLTPVGAALLPHAREVLAAWERGAAEVTRAKNQQLTTLTVGILTAIGRGGTQAAIRSRFTALHPEATVRLRQFSYEDPTAGLADGTADIALVWLPLPDPDRFRWIVLAEDERVAVLREGHRLAARDVIDVADLLDEPFLALPPSAGPLRDWALLLDHRDGRPAKIGAESASSHESYEALVDGRAVCVAPTGNAQLLMLGGLTTRPVRGISPGRLVLAWRAGENRPLVTDYARVCRAAYGR